MLEISVLDLGIVVLLVDVVAAAVVVLVVFFAVKGVGTRAGVIADLKVTPLLLLLMFVETDVHFDLGVVLLMANVVAAMELSTLVLVFFVGKGVAI